MLRKQFFCGVQPIIAKILTAIYILFTIYLQFTIYYKLQFTKKTKYRALPGDFPKFSKHP